MNVGSQQNPPKIYGLYWLRRELLLIGRIRSLLHRVLHPLRSERLQAIARAWRDLPDPLKGPVQALGRQNAGCAAVYRVMDRCDFSCDACYLGSADDRVPPGGFARARGQLDEVRRALGPWGNVQLTGGEITLLPVDELVRLVRYCREIELDAIVMSHGETFRRDPAYLARLVTEGGLEKVAIHVDTTQRGRPGWSRPANERALHPLRDEFAALIRQTRTDTGRPLRACHTVTVTDQNLEEVPEIMRWMADNADAFHLVSFQPAASVGRTRVHSLGAPRDRVWRLISEGLGQPMNRHAFEFGHPDCSEVALAFVVRYGATRQIVQVHRPEAPVDRWFMSALLRSRFRGFVHDGEPMPEVLARLLGIFLRDPRLPAQAAAYCLYRAGTERGWLPDFVQAVATGQPWSIRTLSVVVHNFMSPEQLATDQGQHRARACGFRLPVAGRMVSMCELNAQGRSGTDEVTAPTTSSETEGTPCECTPCSASPDRSAGARRP
jgi:pyruvate-formate lyase-activating enzyme